MAGMKRFVTYIYAYEEKKKANNTGFAKIEIRGEECRMEIHLRGVCSGQTSCRVYLFQKKDGQIEGIRIGEMGIRNGSGDFRTVLKTARILDTPYGFFTMEGIFLLTEDKRIFMSRWKEGELPEISMEHFKEWQKQPEQPTIEKIEPQKQPTIEKTGPQKQPFTEPAKQRKQPEQPITEKTELQKQPTIEKTEPQKQSITEKTEPQKQPSAVRTAQQKPSIVRRAVSAQAQQTSQPPKNKEKMCEQELPVSGEEDVAATELPMRNVFPVWHWEDVWEHLTASYPISEPFSDPDIACVRIELKDLRELPKRYWYLGNNSFLLHGFFNYRYLMLGKKEKGEETRWFLGVPGVFQNQERVMAIIFGFPEFLPEPVENRFGYWCRYLEE